MGQTFVHSLPFPNPQRQRADPRGSGRSEYLGGAQVFVHCGDSGEGFTAGAAAPAPLRV